MGTKLKFSLFSLLALALLGAFVFSPIQYQWAAAAPSGQKPPPFVPPARPHYQPPSTLKRLVDHAAVPGTPYQDYTRITDEHESISVQAPLDWNDISTGRWIVHGKDVGTFISVSPDLNSFDAGGDIPGLFFGVSRDLAGSNRVTNPAQMVNPAIMTLLSNEKAKRSALCRDGGRFDYADPNFQGLYDLYQSCNGAYQELVLVSIPAHQELVAVLVVRIQTQADLEAAAHIFDTFEVLNNQLDDEHND